MKLDMKQVSNQKEIYEYKGDSPYQVPVDSKMVGAHLLGWWPATGVLEHLL
jgi:hypothetical protein